jgi:predicted ribosome quality control (RQC) complex YloA/Tae2 family protein
MHVDHLTLACLRDRLDNLLGARVQRVVLPDERAIALELYAGERHQLLLSADPQHARMLLVPQKPRRGVEGATPLLLLLRKWVRSAHLVDVVQPPWERILELHFEGEAGPCRLVAELIGRYSNLILVGPEGDVLEATKHVGPDINRYRVTLPARPYQPPPQPPGRQPPIGIPAGEWAAMLAAANDDQSLRHLLTSRLFAVSPTAAREIATRVAGDPEAPANAAEPPALAEAVQELFSLLDTGRWAPHVALDEDGDVIAFAPYELRQFKRDDAAAAIEPVPHISEAMWRYFRHRLSADAYAAARQRVQQMIDDARERVEHALEEVRAQRVDAAEVEALREAGELLLTYQHQVEHGASEVTVPDYEGEQRTIALDPTLPPVENAQAYFERYRKAKRAAEEIPARIAALKADRAHLEQLTADLALAESRPEIDAVQESLVEGGWTSRKPKQSSSGQVKGPRRFDVGDFPVFVGRNARQNEQVTFRRGAPEDLWLHVRGRPGAHVIVKRGHREVPEEVVQRAAELAAYFSSMREEEQVAVDVTERRFVQRLRGGHPGQVTYRDERTIWAEPKKSSSEAG